MSPSPWQSVVQISQELGIHKAILYNCSKRWPLQWEVVPPSEKDPESWTGADNSAVVQETAGFNAKKLTAYCREGACSRNR